MKLTFVNVEQLDSNDIAFEGSVAVLGAAAKTILVRNVQGFVQRSRDVNVAVEMVRCDIGVASVALVDTQSANDDLVCSNERRNALSWQIRAKERLALLVVSLLVTAIDVLIVGHTKRRHLCMAGRSAESGELLELGKGLS